MTGVSVPCGLCPAQIQLGMQVCPGCQRPVTKQDTDVLQVRLEGGEFLSHERGKKVRHGAKWVGALAILFLVMTPLSYLQQAAVTERSVASLADFADDDVVEMTNGTTGRAGDLRKQMANEPFVAMAVNLIVAVVMALLWLWARRAPLPAIGCALALFVLLQVVSAVIDPSTIYKGIFIKLLAILALGKGLKAALDARTAAARRSAA